MIAGPRLFRQLGRELHDDFEGSQLDAAVAFLHAHPGQVSPITLSIGGGGDVLLFVAACEEDFTCIQSQAPSAIAATAEGQRVRFADVFARFNPQGDPQAETASICALTLVCTQGDGHPSDLGYRTIAESLFDAADYARLLR